MNIVCLSTLKGVLVVFIAYTVKQMNSCTDKKHAWNLKQIEGYIHEAMPDITVCMVKSCRVESVV